jgi:phosphate transport system protein
VGVALRDDLERLELQLQAEAGLVLRALDAVLVVVETQDAWLADQVIAFDDEVDAAYVRIEEEIQSLLARQTPVAGDLRLVLAILHVNHHLERVADYCVTIAKLTKLTRRLGSGLAPPLGFREMGARALEMIRVALDALALRDLAGAESLVALDELIDDANRGIVDELLLLDGDAYHREWALRMLMVSRSLERIGDHAVDMGEQVAYLVSGDFREFTDASHAA